MIYNYSIIYFLTYGSRARNEKMNDWIVLIVVLSLFILFLVLVGKEVMDRAALVIIFGLSSFAIIHIFAGAPLTMLADFLVGTKEDGYVNLHSILLIFGTSIISFYCKSRVYLTILNSR